MAPKVGISLMLEDSFQPALEQLTIEAIEWSMDQGWAPDFSERCVLPKHVQKLLEEYSAKGCLWGHGVHLSPGGKDELQSAWFARFAEECAEFKFQAVTEHFGFMRTEDMLRGAPLPLPPCSAAVDTLSHNLTQMQKIYDGPIGLENLALAFSKDDCYGQAEVISRALEQVNGCLVLDLHNLYCQCVNYGLAWAELIHHYPLDRVKIIHVSGGSVTTLGGRKFRRDTHDGPIPEDVFTMLQTVLPSVPNLEVVFFEHLGHALDTPDKISGHLRDYRRVFDIVHGVTDHAPLVNTPQRSSFTIIELTPKEYENYQIWLIRVLTAESLGTMKNEILILPSGLQSYVGGFDIMAVAIAQKISHKWVVFKP